jgi:hypothetical protein
VKRGAVLALVALLASCGQPDGSEADGQPNGAIATEANMANGAAPAMGVTEVPLDALAGVRVGMTLADLRAAGFEATKDSGPDPDNRCGYARIKGLDDLFFMLDGDTVVRIDVATPGHPTVGGVAVGMGEGEALRRLGARATVEPHKYTGPTGHYLVVHEAKAPFGLILETDGKSILTYRIGRWDQVQWVEGCL